MSERMGTEGPVIELTGMEQFRDFLSRVDDRTLVSIIVEYADECGSSELGMGDRTEERQNGQSEQQTEQREREIRRGDRETGQRKQERGQREQENGQREQKTGRRKAGGQAEGSETDER